MKKLFSIINLIIFLLMSIPAFGQNNNGSTEITYSGRIVPIIVNQRTAAFFNVSNTGVWFRFKVPDPSTNQISIFFTGNNAGIATYTLYCAGDNTQSGDNLTSFWTPLPAIVYSTNAANPSLTQLNLNRTISQSGSTYINKANLDATKGISKADFAVNGCSQLELSVYTGSAGISADTFSVYGVFNNNLNPSNLIQDPCANPYSVGRKTTTINWGVGNTTIADTGANTNNQAVYVCSLQFTIAGTTPSLLFFSNDKTGGACLGGINNLSGTMLPTSGSYITMGTGQNTIMQSGHNTIGGATQFNICVTLGGTTPSAQGIMTFVSE